MFVFAWFGLVYLFKIPLMREFIWNFFDLLYLTGAIHPHCHKWQGFVCFYGELCSIVHVPHLCPFIPHPAFFPFDTAGKWLA